MKRLSLFVALLLIVAMPMMAERVTPETAQKVAKTFLNNNGAKSAQLTDLTNVAGFSNLYIFNGEEGFVVMAADDRVQPILGYSLTGKFVAEDMPSNVSGWLQGYNDEIQYAIEHQLRATDETIQLWNDLAEGNSKAARATTVVSPLVQTTWDQNGFYYYSGGQVVMFELYNNLCPYDNTAGERTVTGCVATAMAQIMKYWSYPAQGIGSHSYTPSTRPDLGVQSANFGSTNYSWSNMPNSLSQSSSDVQINAIAVLMYHCGVSVDMMYNISANGGSAAYAEDIPYALHNYFNYKSTANIKYKSNYSNNNWINLLKAELDASRPIEYNGSGNAGGHAFVCDGYNSSNQFHFNWGWSGSNDGFYSLTSLNPGSGGAGGGGYVFNDNQSAIFGIEPGSTLPAPTNLTYTLNNTQNLTLTWNGVSAASSYNVYCNNNLIGNTTSTTYAYTAPYGTSAYFVRAVDSSGQQSLPSNTVTVTVDYPTPIVDDLTATLSGNNISLSWTAPEWCYPATPSATLTYGDGEFSGYSLGYGSGSNMYWGHRYLASDLSAYNNMALYKASFYANETGAYKIYVYKGTVSNHPQTQVLQQSLNVGATGWFDFDLSSTIIIDASKDYWVFMYDPEGRSYPATYCSYSGNNGNYYASSPTSSVGTYSGAAFLIKTYVTDGVYTYNLYRNGSPLSLNMTTTSYTDSNRNNTVSYYTVKTNYYGGVTDASNGVGYTLGQALISSLTLNGNDLMTVSPGSKLTVSGQLSSANNNNLVLENGAQLVNNSNNVHATVKKNISAYTGSQNNNWHLVASPISNNLSASATGLLSNNFDLYTFNQSADLEWRNYEAQSFSINNKNGYLYANSGNPTLIFQGTLAGSTTSTQLVYDNTATFKGFNLIGNPYPCNTNVNRSFYVMNEDGSDFILGSNPVAPCAAILVQAQGASQSVTFSKNTSKGQPDISISVTKSNMGGDAIIDRVRVSFNENDRLSKYTMNPKKDMLYIPQNGNDFAVAYADGESEMPINFKTTEDGTYTLHVEAESLAPAYLHVIDDVNGTDIDLLATPSYTFEAKTTDSASRFRLMFAPNKTDGE
ncbi:MAG: C10 family peptidase [Bacteroidales bacterium]|nr:C10 family peptidase [Bacteroidales bacterium]